jgi:hypothetical protein
MKSLLKLYCIVALVCLISCKHEKEETQEATLEIIVSESEWLHEEDSLQLALKENDQIVTSGSWTATSGNITSEGLFFAPVISTENEEIIVSASYRNKKVSTSLFVSKKAFLDTDVSFSQTVLPIFVSNCNFNGCHGNGSRAAQVELSCYDSVFKSIIPYNAAGSRVYFSLIKTDPIRIMPPAGKLHQNKITAVKTWIDQGAKNN